MCIRLTRGVSCLLFADGTWGIGSGWGRRRRGLGSRCAAKAEVVRAWHSPLYSLLRTECREDRLAVEDLRMDRWNLEDWCGVSGKYLCAVLHRLEYAHG